MTPKSSVAEIAEPTVACLRYGGNKKGVATLGGRVQDEARALTKLPRSDGLTWSRVFLEFASAHYERAFHQNITEA